MNKRLMSNTFNLIDKPKIITIDSNIKDYFLDFIKKDSVSIPNYSSKSDTISKTSYHKDDYNSELVELYYEHLYYIVKNVVKFDYFTDSIWYQIYDSNSGSYHGYHDHYTIECPISGIFYLKLFDKKFSTEFMIDGSPKQFDVSEGDMILFDSKIIHRSPPNYGPEDKIIVSFNLCPDVDKS